MRQLLNRWRALWNPDLYHGWGKRRRYFEGWYFKVVAPRGEAALAIIPGMAIEEDGRAEAFVQVLDGRACTATYHPFPATSFRPSSRHFALDIGGNHFSRERVRLDLPGLRGDLRLGRPFPWPATWLAPGIMGWYSFVPFMECYHGVVSMDHALEGSLRYRDTEVDFSGGRGYIEKDWGRSFPAAWIWLQSNHFTGGPGRSLMVSVARIPWLGSFFIGFIVGFLHDGVLYRFASYTGARMRARLQGEVVELEFRDRRHRLRVLAHKGAHGELVSPLQGRMLGKVNESLQARVEVELWEKGRERYRGTGRHAGLELAGPVENLLTSDWRR